MLTEENLKRTIFPLGGYTKQEVRELAQQHKFEKLARKSESQEICFIPDNDYRHFLAEQGCKIEEGNFVNREGKVVGRHKGFCNYTIGQRKGLGVAFGEPYRLLEERTKQPSWHLPGCVCQPNPESGIDRCILPPRQHLLHPISS